MTNTKSSETRPPRFSSGGVLSDGTIYDLILDEGTGTTAFAIAHGAEIAIDDGIEVEGERLSPIPAANNLIRHRAIRLPGVPLEYGTTEQLLAEIRGYIRRYCDLSPDFLVVASVYALFSWVHDAFQELPYLRYRGDFGSGKTRALTVNGGLMYKAFFASAASTVSPIFYTLDLFHGTLILDEADFRFTDKESDIIKILNNGNVAGFPVLRQSMNQKREFDPRAFSVFGPKVVAMRHTFEDVALESRLLTEEMGQREVSPDIPANLPLSQEEEARTLRSKLLMYRLRERNRVRIDPSLVDDVRSARMNQILVPLLSVAPTDAERRAIERVATRVEEDLRTDRALSIEASVLVVLVECFSSALGKPIRVTDVAQQLAAHVGRGWGETLTTRYVGEIIRKRLHLSTRKSHGTYVIPASEEEKIRVLARRYGVLDDAA